MTAADAARRWGRVRLATREPRAPGKVARPAVPLIGRASSGVGFLRVPARPGWAGEALATIASGFPPRRRTTAARRGRVTSRNTCNAVARPIRGVMRWQPARRITPGSCAVVRRRAARGARSCLSSDAAATPPERGKRQSAARASRNPRYRWKTRRSRAGQPWLGPRAPSMQRRSEAAARRSGNRRRRNRGRAPLGGQSQPPRSATSAHAISLVRTMACARTAPDLA
jgi:hypothetical protein